MTNLQRIDPLRPDPSVMKQAADILLRNGVVVAPTETRYGLLARADKAAAVENIYRLKKRNDTLAMAVFIRNAADISRFGRESLSSRKLVSAFWPGPITLVIPAVPECPARVVVDGKIGLRCSPSPVIAGLIQTTDLPLTGTSANISQGPDLDSVSDIANVFGADVDIYLDGGPLSGPVSTVVECFDDNWLILRDGAVTRKEITAKLGS